MSGPPTCLLSVLKFSGRPVLWQTCFSSKDVCGEKLLTWSATENPSALVWKQQPCWRCVSGNRAHKRPAALTPVCRARLRPGGSSIAEGVFLGTKTHKRLAALTPVCRAVLTFKLAGGQGPALPPQLSYGSSGGCLAAPTHPKAYDIPPQDPGRSVLCLHISHGCPSVHFLLVLSLELPHQLSECSWVSSSCWDEGVAFTSGHFQDYSETCELLTLGS